MLSGKVLAVGTSDKDVIAHLENDNIGTARRRDEVAEKSGATPYDLPGVELTHDVLRCSVDAILKKCKLNDPVPNELPRSSAGLTPAGPILPRDAPACSRSRSA